MLSNRKNCACNFCEKVFQKTKLIAAILVAFIVVPAFASTDIQPNGNLAGGSTAANCTQPVLGTYSGSTNFEAKWRANEVPLKWYNGDTEMAVQSASSTCSYDGTLTIPATAPNRVGYVFDGWKVIPSNVPSGYTKLEYIRSDGGQRIDTGIIATEKTAVETEFINHYSESTTRIIIGDFWGGNSKYVLSIVAQTNAPLRIGAQSITKTSFWTVGTLFKVSMNASGVVINGTATSWPATPTAFTSSGQLRMFGVADASRNSIATMYYMRIWNDEVLVRNYIPARRNSDNVVGMYDTVSNTFFTNAVDNTSFAAGPAVN